MRMHGHPSPDAQQLVRTLVPPLTLFLTFTMLPHAQQTAQGRCADARTLEGLFVCGYGRRRGLFWVLGGFPAPLYRPASSAALACALQAGNLEAKL